MILLKAYLLVVYEILWILLFKMLFMISLFLVVDIVVVEADAGAVVVAVMKYSQNQKYRTAWGRPFLFVINGVC